MYNQPSNSVTMDANRKKMLRLSKQERIFYFVTKSVYKYLPEKAQIFKMF